MNSLLAKGCNFVWDFCKENLSTGVDLKSPEWKQVSDNLRQFGHFCERENENFGAAYSGGQQSARLRTLRTTLRIGEGKPNCVFY